MVKMATGWTCNACGFAPFAPKAAEASPPAAPAAVISLTTPLPENPTPAPVPEASQAPSSPMDPSSSPSPAPSPDSPPSADPYAQPPASNPYLPPSTYSPYSPPASAPPANPDPGATPPVPSYAPSPYAPPGYVPPPAVSPPPAPRPGGFVAPSRAGFSPRPLPNAPAAATPYTPIYSAGPATSASPPSSAGSPPTSIPPTASNFPHNPVAPDKSIYAYADRQSVYDLMPWRPAGGGLRFSRDIPLRTLPPGEPIYVEMMVQNQGSSPLAVTYYLFLTNANLQGTKLQGESLDIPPGSVLDVSHTLAANLQLGDYAITVFCVPRTTLGRNQDPNSFPTLAPVEGALPSGLPSLYEVLKIRRDVACPNCQGKLQWTPAGMGGRVRAWVCGRCGNRIENGVV